jgi:hypothetical protein
MSVLRALINGQNSSPVWTGSYTDIDEGVISPNDSDYITTQIKNEYFSATLEDSATIGLNSGDYVKQVGARVRAATVGSGNDSFAALTGSGDSGITHNLSATIINWRDFHRNSRNLGTGYTATLDAMNMLIEGLQTGMPAAMGVRIYAAEVYLEVFPATVAKGDLVHFAEGVSIALTSTTATFLNSHTATSGNILLAVATSDTGVVHNTPSGYMLRFGGNWLVAAKRA